MKTFRSLAGFALIAVLFIAASTTTSYANAFSTGTARAEAALTAYQWSIDEPAPALLPAPLPAEALVSVSAPAPAPAPLPPQPDANGCYTCTNSPSYLTGNNEASAKCCFDVTQLYHISNAIFMRPCAGGTNGAWDVTFRGAPTFSFRTNIGAITGATETVTASAATNWQYTYRITGIQHNATTLYIKDSSTEEIGITIAPNPYLAIVATATNPTQAICSGGNITAKVISATNQTDGTYAFKWSRGNTSYVTGAASGTDQNITATALTNNTAATQTVVYSATATLTGTNNQSCSATNSVATVTVYPVVATPQPTAATVCYNTTHTFSLAVATGGNSAYTYAWEQSPNGSTGWVPATGTSNAAAYTTPALTVDTYYRRKVTSCSSEAITDAVKVTVLPNTAPTLSLSNTAICNNTDAGAITVSSTATVMPSSYTYSYTWLGSTSAATTTAASAGNLSISMGSNNNTAASYSNKVYTVTPIYTGGGKTCNGLPGTATLSVLPTVTSGVATTATQQVCAVNAVVNIPVTADMAGAASYSYSWTASCPAGNVDGTLFNSGTLEAKAGSSGAATLTGSLNNTSAAARTVTFAITPRYYYGGVWCTGTSFPATVTLSPNTPPNLVKAITSPVCSNVSAGTIDGSTTQSATWEYTMTTPSGVTTGNPKTGSFGSNTDITIPAATFDNNTNQVQSVTYTVVATYAGNCASSNSVTVQVMPNAAPVLTPAAQNVCWQGNATIGVSGAQEYTWSRAAANYITTQGAGADQSGLISTPVGNITATNFVNSNNKLESATYTVTPVYKSGVTSCTGTRTASAVVTVLPHAGAQLTPATQTVCGGTAAQPIVVTRTVTEPSTSYTWTASANAPAASGSISGDTGSIVPGNLANTTGYSYTIIYTVTPKYSHGTLTGCAGAATTATVNVLPTNAPNVTLDNTLLCSGDTPGQLRITGTAASYSVRIEYPGVATTTNTYTATSGNYDLTLSANDNTGQSHQVKTITVTPIYTDGVGNCNGTPVVTSATVLPRVTVTPSIPNSTVCSGTPLTITVDGSGRNANSLTYAWSYAVVGGTLNGSGALGSNSGSLDAGTATGQATLSGTLNNTGNDPATLTMNYVPTYTLGTKSCQGVEHNTQKIVILPAVQATANLSAEKIYTGRSATVTLSTPLVGGTMDYTWSHAGSGYTAVTAPAIGTIANVAEATSAYINGTFTNTSSSASPVPATVTFTITPTYKYNGAVSCPMTPLTKTLIVLPPAKVTPIPAVQVVCSSGSINLAVEDESAEVTSGVVYSWSRTITPTQGGELAQSSTLPRSTSTTTDLINYGLLYNSTTGTVTVQKETFEITPTYDVGGVAAPVTAAVYILPKITQSTATPVATSICSGSAASFTIVSAAKQFSSGNASVRYNWEIVNAYEINLPASAATGTASVNAGGIATNTTIVTSALVNNSYDLLHKDITIEFTPYYIYTSPEGITDECAGDPFTATVKILSAAAPVINVPEHNICSGSEVNVTIITNEAASYTWQRTGGSASVTPTANAGVGTTDSNGSAFVNTFTNASVAPATLTYSFTARYPLDGGGYCESPAPASTMQVIISPAGTPSYTLTPSLPIVCSGAPLPEVAVSGSSYVQSFNWSLDYDGSVLGNPQGGNTGGYEIGDSFTIAPVSLDNASLAPAAATFTVTPMYEGGVYGCMSDTPLKVVVTVLPNAPVNLVSAAEQTICAGTTSQVEAETQVTAPGMSTLYEWTREYDGVTTTHTGNLVGLGSASNVNTTDMPKVAAYTVTPEYRWNGQPMAGCNGSPTTATVTVLGSAAPVLSPATQTICHSAASNGLIAIAGNGASYTWTRNNTQAAGTITAGSLLPTSELAPNTSNAIRAELYQVRAIYTGGTLECPGAPSTPATITVLPSLQGGTTTAASTICSGATLKQQLSLPGVGLNGGASYSYVWTATASSSSVTGALLLGGETTPQALTASTLEGELINTSTVMQQVEFTITPVIHKDGIRCEGKSFGSTVTVSPGIPAALTPSAVVICSGENAGSITIATDAAATYRFTRTSASGANYTGGGTNPGLIANGTTTATLPLGTFTNATGTPQTVTYNVTTSYPGSGCSITSSTYITIMPSAKATVTIGASAVTTAVCSDEKADDIQIKGTAFSYHWARTRSTDDIVETNDEGLVTAEADGSAVVPMISFTNSGTAIQSVTYTVYPVYRDVATGVECPVPAATSTVTIQVMPTAAPILSLSSQTVCATVPAKTIAVTTSAASYSWVRTGISPTTSATLARTAPVPADVALLNPTDVAQVATYTITPIWAVGTKTCAGSPTETTVKVLPSAAPTLSITGASDLKVCAGTVTTLEITGTAQSYTWYRNNGAPNVVTGPTNTVSMAAESNVSGAPMTNITYKVIPIYTDGTLTCTIPYSAPVTGSTVSAATIQPVILPAPQTVTNSFVAAPAVVCSGSDAVITVRSNVAEAGKVAFAWTRNHTEISTGMGELSGNSGEVLSGSPAAASASFTGSIQSDVTVPITYSFIPYYVDGTNRCEGQPFSGTLTVLSTVPAVVTPDVATNNIICSGGSPTFTITTDSNSPASFTWSRSNLPSSSVTAPAVSGILSAVTHTREFTPGTFANTSDEAATITYSFNTYYTANGTSCSSTAPTTSQVIVMPSAAPELSPAATVCSNGTAVDIGITGKADNYEWTRTGADGSDVTVVSGNVADNGNITQAQSVEYITGSVFNNTTNAVKVIKYVVTPTYSEYPAVCIGKAATTTITVLPHSPASVSHTAETVCSGAPTKPVVLKSEVTAGAATSYTWTIAYDGTTTSHSYANSSATITPGTFLNDTGVAKDVVITITPHYTAGTATCSGDDRTVTITINPSAVPVLTYQHQTVCHAGEGAYGAVQNIDISGTALSYTWKYIPPQTSASQTGSLTAVGGAATLPISTMSEYQNNGNSSVQKYRIEITPVYAEGCAGTPATATVAVIPRVGWQEAPVPAATVLCHATPLNIIVKATAVPTDGSASSFDYTWEREDASLGGSTPLSGTVAPANFNSSSTASLSVDLTNTTPAPQTTAFTFTPRYTYNGNACYGIPSVSTVTMLPQVAATVTPGSLTNVYSGNDFPVVLETTPAALTGGEMEYRWVRTNGDASSGNVQNEAAAGTITAPDGSPYTHSFNFTNNTEDEHQTDITYTPVFKYTAGGTVTTCSAAPFTVGINVLPPSVVEVINATQVICSGTSSKLVSFIDANAWDGATYSWVRTTSPGANAVLPNDAADVAHTFTTASTNTPGISAQVFTNTTEELQKVVYTVTPQYPAGTSTPFEATIYVLPKVTSATVTPAIPVICSGGTTQINITDGASTASGGGVYYTWSRPTFPNLSSSLGTSGTFAATATPWTLTATSGAKSYQEAPLTVTPYFHYNIVVAGTATSNTCTGDVVTAKVIVLPQITDVTVNPITQPMVCPGASITPVTFTSAFTPTGAVSYAWTRDNAGADGVTYEGGVAGTCTTGSMSGSFTADLDQMNREKTTRFTITPLYSYTHTDGSVQACPNNTSYFDVKVGDVTNPVAQCQPATVTIPSAGSTTVMAMAIDNGSSDNCTIVDYRLTFNGITSSTTTPHTVTGALLGTHPATLTVVDVAGNMAACATTITVDSDELPTITCPASQPEVEILSACSATATNLAATFWSNLPEPVIDWTITRGKGTSTATAITAGSYTYMGTAGVTATSTFTSYTFDSTGVYTIDYTITDKSAKTATCSFDVTVVDKLAPTAVCAGGTVTVYLDSTGLHTLQAHEIDGGSTDNCKIVKYEFAGIPPQTAFDCSDLGEAPVHGYVLRVIDQSGNENQTACNTSVEVKDTIAPWITCQPAATYDLSATTGDYVLTAESMIAAANDNCGTTDLTYTIGGVAGATAATYHCADAGAHSLTIYVTDRNGTGNSSTCTHTFTINDTEPMVVTPPRSVFVPMSAGVCERKNYPIAAATYTDNCAATKLEYALDGATNVPRAEVPATCTGTNAAGAATFSAPRYDLAQGATTITYYVTDAAGSVTSATFVLTVYDNHKPEFINVLADRTAVPADAGTCTATLTDVAATAGLDYKDNCTPKASITLEYELTGATTHARTTGTADGTVFNLGATTVTYYITDNSATNTASSSFVVTVVDNQTPTISCGGDRVLNALPGACSYTVTGDELQPTFADNCSATILNDYNNSATLNGVQLPAGETIITWTVTDGSSNTATCTYKLKVVSDVLAQPAVATFNNGAACGASDKGLLWIDNLSAFAAASTYQWYKDGAEIPGATEASYEADASGVYKVVVGNGGCEAHSEGTTVTIGNNPGATVPNLTADQGITTICGDDGSVTLLLANSSAFTPGTVTYKWFRDGVLLTADEPTLTVRKGGEGNYKVYVAYNDCAASSGEVTVTSVVGSMTKPEVKVTNNGIVCTGGDVTLWIATTGYTTPTYQWYRNGAPISGATLTSYTADQAGTYKLAVVSDGNCAATSDDVVVTVSGSTAMNPQLTADRGVAAICGPDGSVTLQLNDYTGLAAATYTWFHNDAFIGETTQPTLAVTKTAYGAGTYVVAVSAADGCAAKSNEVAVTETATNFTKPLVAQSSESYCAGGSVGLWITNIATAGYTAPAYQWYKNGDPIPGATNAYYEADAAGSYKVSVTDNVTCAAVSDELEVKGSTGNAITPPTLAAAPGTEVCGTDGSVVLSIDAAYATYTWFKDGQLLSGKNQPTLTVGGATADAGAYQAFVQDAAGCGVMTNLLPITVSGSPSTLAVPTLTLSGSTFCAGGSASLWINNADGYASSAVYQWYKDGAPITGATNAYYAATATAGSYKVSVTDGSCAAMSAEYAITEVGDTPITAPTLTAAPDVNAVICGTNGSVVLSVGGGSYDNYTWFKDGKRLTSVGNQPTLTVGSAATGTYQVFAETNGCGGYTEEVPVTLGSGSGPVVPVVTASNGGVYCATNGSVGLWITNTGDYSAPVYQWYHNGTPIAAPAGKAPHYEATAAGTYHLVVTDGTCAAASSYTEVTEQPGNTAVVPMLAFVGGTQICGPDGSVTLYFDNTFTSPTYTWFKNDTLISHTQPTLTLGAADIGRYKAYVTDGGCGAFSNEQLVEVTASTVTKPVLNLTAGGTYCTGEGSTGLWITNAGDYTAPAYQWYHNGSTLTAPAGKAPHYEVTAAGTYHLVVTDGGCEAASLFQTVTEGSTNLAVKPDLNGVDGITDICGPDGSITLQLANITPTSTTQYAWFKNDTLISGHTQPTLTLGAAATGTYKVYVTDGTCGAFSNEMPVALNGGGNTIHPLDLVVTHDGTACTGGNVGLWITNYGDYTPVATYRWYKNDTLVAAAGKPTYAATATGEYLVTVTYGTCAVSAGTHVTVSTGTGTPAVVPQIALAHGDADICGDEGSVTLKVDNINPNDPAVYAWFRNDTILNGQTEPVLTVDKTLGAGTYSVFVTYNNCGAFAAAAQTVTFGNPGTVMTPAPVVATSGSTFCTGGSIAMWLTNTGDYTSAATYQWYRNGVLLSGAQSPSYAATASGSYKVVVTDYPCETTSTLIDVTEDDTHTITPPVLQSAYNNTQLCGVDGAVLLEAKKSPADGGGYYTSGTYVWFRNDTLIPGFNEPTLVVENTPAGLGAGIYKVYVQDASCGGAFSAPVTVAAPDASATTITVPLVGLANNGAACAAGAEVGLWITNVNDFDPDATYYWYRNGILETGANRPAFAATLTGDYRVVIAQGTCVAASTVTPVEINGGGSSVPPVLVAKDGIAQICGDEGVVKLAIDNFEGFDPDAAALSFNWFRNDTLVGTNVSAGSTPVSAGFRDTLVLDVHALAGEYKVYVSDGDCGAFSTPITVAKNADTEPPMFALVPVAVDTIADLNKCTTLLSDTLMVTFTDNCFSDVRLAYRLNGATVKDSTEITPVAKSGSTYSGTFSAEFDKGATTVTYYITDGSGNSTDTTFVVTVRDTQLPKFALYPSNIDTVTTTGCTTPFLTDTLKVSFDDNCGPAGVQVAYRLSGATVKDSTEITARIAPDVACLPDTAFEIGVTTVTYYLTDDSHNTDSVSFMITVDDNIPPTITCMPAQTFSTSSLTCSYTVVGTELDPASYTDNCCTPAIRHDYSFGGNTLADTVLAKGVHTINWTVEDAAGNTATCSVEVTIEDKTDPILTCQSDTIVKLGKDQCEYVVAGDELDPTWSDNCGSDQVYPWLTLTGTSPSTTTLSGMTFTASPRSAAGSLTPHEVTWQAVDAAGNMADACILRITVEDTNRPTPVCNPQTLTIGWDGTATVSADTVGMGSHANCTDHALDYALDRSTFSCADASYAGTTHTVTLTVTDQVTGLDSTATCAITVLDTITPIIHLPANITADMAGCTTEVSGLTPYEFKVTCEANYRKEWKMEGATTLTATTYTGDDSYSFNPGTTTVTFMATNIGTGQVVKDSSLVVNVRDVTRPLVSIGDPASPTAVAAATMTVAADEGTCESFISLFYEDENNGPLIEFTDECLDALEFTWEIEDHEGTKVPDTAADTAELKQKTFVFARDTSILRFTVIDGSGNDSTVVLTVVVLDEEDPVLNQPKDTLLVCAADPFIDTVFVKAQMRLASSPNEYGYVTDNCTDFATSGRIYSEDLITGSSPQPGCNNHTIIRKWWAVDEAGNTSATATQTITVRDTTRPWVYNSNSFAEVFATRDSLGNIIKYGAIQCDNLDDTTRALNMWPQFTKFDPASKCYGGAITDSATVDAVTRTYTLESGATFTVRLISSNRVPIDPVQDQYELVRVFQATDACGNVSNPVEQRIVWPMIDVGMEATLTKINTAMNGLYYGDKVEYKVVVRNLGSCYLNNGVATVIGKLPQGITYLSHTTTVGDYNSATGEWEVGPMEPSILPDITAETLTITGWISTPEAGTIADKVWWDKGDTKDFNPSNDTAFVALPTLGQSASLTKSVVGRNTANVGDTVTFSIRVTNLAAEPNNNLSIVDLLPQGLQLVDYTYETGTEIYPSRDTILFAVPALQPGDSKMVTLKARVTEGANLTNRAEVWRGKDSSPWLAEASIGIVATSGNLSISAKIQEGDYLLWQEPHNVRGDEDRYSIENEYTILVEVENIGGIPIRTSDVTATYDPALQQVIQVNQNGVIANGKVYWTLGELGGQNRAAELQMRVRPLLQSDSPVRDLFEVTSAEEGTELRGDNKVVLNIDQQVWEIPNVLTPDAPNNVWRIPNLDNNAEVESVQVVITNSWGNMVYRSSNYKGLDEAKKFNTFSAPGSNLAKGTYYYKLTVNFSDPNRQPIVRQSYITLLK